MVRVHVRDVDFVDLLGLVTGRFQVGQHLAQRGAEQRAGAGIDQDQLGAGIDQVSVVGRFQRACNSKNFFLSFAISVSVSSRVALKTGLRKSRFSK